MANEYYTTRTGKKLLLHSGRDATDKAYIYIDDESVTVANADGDMGLVVADDYGVAIQGPTSIIASPEEVRIHGLWTLNPAIISCIPSTVYTPIPVLKESTPTSSKKIAEGISTMMAVIQGIL